MGQTTETTETNYSTLIATPEAVPGTWQKWFGAFKQIFPLYVAIHLLFLVVSWLAPLHMMTWANDVMMPFYTLWHEWHRWDTGHYLLIATKGYGLFWQTAFFPLYPLLIRLTMFVIPNSMIAALFVSNIANALMLMVFYQLVLEDFDDKVARRAVLYISIFPMSFFLVAAYPESLFLAMALFTFYHARRGNWWLAGGFGLLAGLTRPAGVLLLLPLCFEYVRQRQFQWRQIRWSVLALGLVPGGIALYALYCFWRFGDPLTFAHAQSSNWNREFTYPWWGIVTSLTTIFSSKGPLSFKALHNLTELGPILVVLSLLILGIVGPWRFRKAHIAYVLLGVVWMFFNLSEPVHEALFPLRAQARYALEVFPAFVVLAVLGRYRTVHLSYTLVSTVAMCSIALQFLTGHWIT